MEEKIIETIEKVSGYKNLKENMEVDLFENNILDSLAFIELVSELEDEFDIEIQLTQIPPNTWKKVKTIVELVENMKNN